MASTPKLIGILDQLVDNFEAMAEATSHYLPDKVYRVSSYADGRLFDSSVGEPATIYAVRAGDSRTVEWSTGDATSGGFSSAEVEMFVLAMRNGGTDDNTDEVEVRENLTRDALRVLLMDPTVDGLAVNVADGEITVNRDFFVDGLSDGWICTEIAFPLRYSFQATAP